MLHHRGKAKTRRANNKPTSHTATKANEVWSWDISYLPTTVIGLHYYLYMIEDIYSRKIVGWEVHTKETGEQAAELLERSIWLEKCRKQNLVLHSDNGAPMKSLTMQAKMHDLGVISSGTRPRVSNDNPYSESLFRTVKYCPRWPSEGFNSLDGARKWVKGFVYWYNNEHRHSRIKFVTPNQRHQGLDIEILENAIRDKGQELKDKFKTLEGIDFDIGIEGISRYKNLTKVFTAKYIENINLCSISLVYLSGLSIDDVNTFDVDNLNWNENV